MTTKQKQTSFWAKDFLRYTQGLYDPAVVEAGRHLDKIKFLETRALF
jgi:hypothetical protein